MALTLFVAVIGLVGPGAEFEVYDDALTATVFVSVLLTATAVAVCGVYWAAILVEPGWVTVRRALWTHRVPASEVDRFEPPRTYGSFRQTGLRVVLRDGRVLSGTAFNKGPIDSDSVGRAEAAELNAWLAMQGAFVVR
ncbi:hypothetical protein [Blastococcus montanus]|uniref:hypothetical protein n=1 Tax=Blastococcus montanus TaxID=3144973 RepID=UPI0032084A2B